MQELLGGFLYAVAIIALLVFLVIYFHRRFWRSIVGWYIAGFNMVLTAMFIIAPFRPVPLWVSLVLLAAMDVVLVGQVWLLLRAGRAPAELTVDRLAAPAGTELGDFSPDPPRRGPDGLMEP